MEVITRAAPTLSGSLHLGTLYNALLNYAFAKREGGLFFLRLDGQKVGDQRRKTGDSIIQDLITFGMRPDRIIWQCDSRGWYRQQIEEIVSDPRVYCCDCTAGDIFERTRFDQSKLKALIREEKYPGPCEIQRIKIFNANRAETRRDVALGCKVQTSIEAKGFEAQNVTDGSERSWKAYEVGALCDRDTHLTIDLGREVWIGAAEIRWNFYPVKSYGIRLPDRRLCRGEKLVSITRENNFCVSSRTNGAYEGAVADQLSFAPVKTRFITLEVNELCHEIRREYYYDDYCRDLQKEGDLRSARTVLRVRSESPLDVAIYFNRLPDLCFTSALDDQEAGITHSIRGLDIQPFSLLEREAGKLIGYVANNLFHGMVVDHRRVKLSKFIGSPPAVGKLQGGTTPNEVLTNLARSAGIISWKSDLLGLPALVKAIDFKRAFSSFPTMPNFEYCEDW